ncbi:UNVERIFIED_CONTAM: hypothetical protein GTU68_058167 [Idotea baltica]|nr:hypothetical protein [Idotea baltica]
MDSIKVIGGGELNGTIPISGAKNATLPLMIASLLTDETLTLTNVPRLRDVAQTLNLTAREIVDTTAPYELVSKMRASFWVVGPLVARCHEARVSLPGGCAIGTRPVDFFIDGLSALGATGTYAMAVAMTGGDVLLQGARSDLLEAALDTLRQTGADITQTPDGLKVYRNGNGIQPVDVTTEPFPGFPTDLQAQFMALMTKAGGTSRITETIFENRFMHVQELARLGAQINVDGRTATVDGVATLRGAPVMATDLRASVSLVIAGLAAEGETTVNRVYHLDRGFERLEDKLTRCGAQIERISS